jgi:O-antigen ligase
LRYQPLYFKLVNLAILAAPFIGIVPFNVSGYGMQISTLVLGTIGAYLLVKACASGAIFRMHIDAITLFVLLYFLASLLSIIGVWQSGNVQWGTYTQLAKYLRGVASVFLLVLVYFSLRLGPLRDWDIAKLIRSYTLASTLHATFGIYQVIALYNNLPFAYPLMNNNSFYAVTPANLPSPRAFGFTPEPSMFAITLLPAWLAEFITPRRRWLRFLVLSIALLLSKSRLGLVSCVLTILVAAFCRVWSRRRGQRILIPLSILTLIVIAILTLYMVIGNNLVTGSQLADYDPSLGERFSTAVIAFRMFLANPLFGVGLGSYPLMAVMYLKPNTDFVWGIDQVMTGQSYIFPNNAFLEVSAQQGILGIVSFIGILLSVVWYLALASKNGMSVPYQATICALGITLTSLFSGFTFVPIWIFLGLSSVSLQKGRERI